MKTARFEVLSPREFFGQASAQVDEGTHAVRIPESLVQWALEQAPSSFTLSGHYLTEPHTRRHFRREHYIPRLLVREGTETWEKEGRRTVLDRARERVRAILDDHQPRELDPAVEKGLREYLEMTRARSVEGFMTYEDEARQDFM